MSALALADPGDEFRQRTGPVSRDDRRLLEEDYAARRRRIRPLIADAAALRDEMVEYGFDIHDADTTAQGAIRASISRLGRRGEIGSQLRALEGRIQELG